MRDPIVNSLIERTNWTHHKIYNMMDELTEQELCEQPSSAAPSIGWHGWHIARIADMLQASFPNRQQVWEKENLASTFGLDPSKLGLLQQGATLSPQDASTIPSVIGKERLINYARTVFDLSTEVMSSLTLDDFYARRESMLKIDWSTRPPSEGKGSEVVLIDDINFHLGHAQRHLGSMEATIGITLNRSGTATI